MSDTLRDQIAALPRYEPDDSMFNRTPDGMFAWEDGGWLRRSDVLAILDAHTAEPAPAQRRAREQMTGCDDCGKELPHDAAVWTTDGASYCPKCRPQIAAAPVMDQPAPDAVAEALEQMVLHFQHWEMDMATQKPRIVDFEHQPYAVQKAMRALGKEPRT